MGSFDDEISELFEQHDDAERTRAKSKDREEDDRQIFLRSFRDKLLNVIVPVLVAVEKNPKAQSKATIKQGQDPSGYNGYLKIKVGKNQPRQLLFSADYNRKRVLVTKLDTLHRVIELEEVTEQLVQEEVRIFLQEALEPARP